MANMSILLQSVHVSMCEGLFEWMSERESERMSEGEIETDSKRHNKYEYSNRDDDRYQRKK